MIVESPIYRLGAWRGNVTDAFGVDWIVEEEDGWSSSPPVRPVQEDRTGADGAWTGPGLYSARVITLAGKAIASNRLAMLQAKERLKATIGPRSRIQLQVDEEHLSRCAQVRLSDQVQITDLNAIGFSWSLILVSGDPRRYSTYATSQTAELPSSSLLGRTYSRTFPYAYGVDPDGVGNGSVFVFNEGDFDETPATITITGPVTNPQIAHAQSGRSLTFGLSLGEEQYLEIGLLNTTALLNGTASRAGTITPGSSWFMLAPGPNELQFRGQAVAGTTTPTMTVTAASAWT